MAFTLRRRLLSCPLRAIFLLVIVSLTLASTYFSAAKDPNIEPNTNYRVEISYRSRRLLNIVNNTDLENRTNGTTSKDREFPNDIFSLEQKRRGAVVLHIVGVLYMFVALAIVCDEFFIPALEIVAQRLKLSNDVAGATFMAAGGSAPEFFTSVAGVFFAKDAVGFGTIVGSAVFNILFVISMCSLLAKGVLALTWWPLFRDAVFYSIALSILIVFYRDGKIEWYESLVLFVLYIIYAIFMGFNSKIEFFVKDKLSYVKLPCCRIKAAVQQITNQSMVVDNDSTDQGARSELIELEQYFIESKPSSIVADKENMLLMNGHTNFDNHPLAPQHTPRPYRKMSSNFSVDINGDVHENHSRDLLSPSYNRNRMDSPYYNEDQLSNTDSGIRSNSFYEKTSIPDSAIVGVCDCEERESSPESGIRLVPPRHERVNSVRNSANSTTSSHHPLMNSLSSSSLHQARKVSTPSGANPVMISSLSQDCSSGVAAANRNHRLSVPCYPSSSRRNSTWEAPSSSSQIISNSTVIIVTHSRSETSTHSGKSTRTNSKSQLMSDSSPQIISVQPIKTDNEDQDDSADNSNNNKDDDDDEDIGFSSETRFVNIIWPKGCKRRIAYFLLFPLIVLLYFTLPDVNKPFWKLFFPWTFIGSIGWIMVFSYLMVWWSTEIGDTFSISPAIMGLTFLAAGTSIPDLISSVIVARKGLGDMALSSSIGSNMFDVTVGLPIPWLLYSAINGGEAVDVASSGLFCSIVLLVLMLCVTIVSIAVLRWQLNKILGVEFLICYCVFLTLSLLLELDKIDCPAGN